MKVMVTRLREYTKKHSIAYFKWVGYTACELYFNKAVARQNGSPEAPLRCPGWAGLGQKWRNGL